MAFCKTTLACNCLPDLNFFSNSNEKEAIYSSYKDAYDSSSLVAIAKVIQIDFMEKEYELVVTFELTETIKGDPKRIFHLTTAPTSAGCGYPFKRDQTYILYAFEDSDGNYSTESCSHTEILDKTSEEEIAYLRTLKNESK